MITLNNLKLQYIQDETLLRKSIKRVMSSGVYLMGKELATFEKEFSKYLGAKYALGVGSGTDALTLAIKSLDLKAEDEVIIPANVYPTVFGVAASGVKIRLCDVEKDTLNISVNILESLINRRTKCVIAVHLYGMPAPVDKIAKWAKRNKVKLIEDCAQAMGAKINGKSVGTFGDIGCFSFYPTKNLGAMGDGGAIVAKSERIIRKIKKLRMYGETIRYHSSVLATHSRLDEIQSAILRVRLKKLDSMLRDRDRFAKVYRSSLPNSILIPQSIPNNVTHANHLFVLRVSNRDKLKEFLRKSGIETGIHYPEPIHFQTSFKYLGYKKGDFPVSEEASNSILSLPFHYGILPSQQGKVIGAIKKFYGD